MKRRLFALALMVLLLATIAWTPPTAECFGCTAEAKQQCRNEMNRVAEECANFFWPYNQEYCFDQGEQAYYHCLVTKGCPAPVKNP